MRLSGDVMKRKRWKKWLLWSGGVLVVLLVLGYIGMNLSINYALKAISTVDSKFVVSKEIADKPKTTDETPATPVGTKSNVPEAVGSPSSSNSPEENGKGSLGDQAGKDMPGAVSLTPTSSSSSSSTTNPQESTPIPSASSASKNGKLTYQAEVSADKAKAVEDSISLKEKAAVTAVLLKKLSASDLQLLVSMMSNGMSIDEKKAAKKIIMEKLTEDEYNQLIGIAAKYGLSQGKSYSTTSGSSNK
jgi:hypothetical protein